MAHQSDSKIHPVFTPAVYGQAVSLLHALSIPAILVDERLRIVGMNERIATHTDFHPRELEKDTPLAAFIRHAFKTRAPVTEHNLVIAGIAHRCTVGFTAECALIELMRINPVADGHIAFDIAARQIIHEIRNPLSGIAAAAQILCRASLSDDDKELATLIHGEAKRIETITHALDSLAEPDVPDHISTSPTFNPHVCIDAAINIIKLSRGYDSIVRTYDPSLPDVQGNEDLLRQALINLLDNAITAVNTLPDSIGCITVSTSYAITPPRTGVDDFIKRHFCLRVTDTGPGISEDNLPHIFTPFYTTKQKAKGMHGLGLPIVRKNIARLGGIIEAQSAAGKTTFTIYLPFSGQENES